MYEKTQITNLKEGDKFCYQSKDYVFRFRSEQDYDKILWANCYIGVTTDFNILFFDQSTEVMKEISAVNLSSLKYGEKFKIKDNTYVFTKVNVLDNCKQYGLCDNTAVPISDMSVYPVKD